jgi:hypothetical protein
MRKASEYRQHAEECRSLAASMPSDAHRDQLLEMAEQWEKLAEERLTLIANHPELALPGEREEARSWLPPTGR